MKHHLLTIEALVKLRPGIQVTVHQEGEDDIIEVLDDTVLPSDEEILAECERMEAAGELFHDNERNRGLSYPSLGDQFDMIYKDRIDGGTRHHDAVSAVKTKFPKE